MNRKELMNYLVSEARRIYDESKAEEDCCGIRISGMFYIIAASLKQDKEIYLSKLMLDWGKDTIKEIKLRN